MNEQRAKIYEDIEKERAYSDQKWGTAFDDKNTLNDWVTYISMYATGAARIDVEGDVTKQRAGLIKVANLAVAAIECLERNGQFAPRHYDQGFDAYVDVLSAANAVKATINKG